MILAREFGEDPIRAQWSYAEFRDRLLLLSEERVGRHIRRKARRDDRAVASLKTALPR